MKDTQKMYWFMEVIRLKIHACSLKNESAVMYKYLYMRDAQKNMEKGKDEVEIGSGGRMGAGRTMRGSERTWEQTDNREFMLKTVINSHKKSKYINIID